MADPHFYLKDKKSSSDTLILLHWLIDGRRFRYSTGQKIRPSLWSAKKERALPRHIHSESINSRLDRIESAARKQYEKLANGSGYVSFDELRKAINVASARSTSGQSVFTYYEQFKASKLNQIGFRESSIKSYNSAIKNLSEYCQFIKQGNLDFSHVNTSFLASFERFLISKDLSSNYVRKMISKVITVLRQAIKDGVTDQDHFEGFEISTNKEDSTAIYLNESEIKALLEIDLSKDKRLERVRDVFAAGCLTGLRYSDYKKIRRDNIRTIEGFEFLVVLMQKQKDQVFIPVSDQLIAILDKYNGVLPVISDVKMNAYLKEIGPMLDSLRETVDRVSTKGGVKKSIPVPRYKLLSTHTARRSFATNAYLSGWDMKAIRSVTGHSTNEMLERYIRITKQENAIRVATDLQQKKKDQRATVIESLRLALDMKEFKNEKDTILSLLEQLEVDQGRHDKRQADCQ